MMRTMSLYESGESNGSISLIDLKNNIFKTSFSDKNINDYAFYICRGGWPLSLNQDRDIALGLTPGGLFRDITTFGLLFESLVIRDLRIYCDSIRARVYKYRDSKKREADAVIVFNDGSWALVEVKLGGEEDIKEACENLIKIAKDIDVEKTGKPAFLMVVTKNKFAYKTANGVYVVPLACLKN